MTNNEDWKNEKGIQDASYQDFVAPLVAGIGGIPRIMALTSKAPAIVAGLATAPKVQEGTKDLNIDMSTVEDMLMKWRDLAQKIGDFPRVFKYKALQSALGEEQFSPSQVLDMMLKIHAD